MTWRTSCLFFVLFLILPRAAKAQAVDVEVRETASATDDYIGWAPTVCRIRLAAPAAVDVKVTLGNDSPNPTGAGELCYEQWQNPWPKEKTATNASVDLTLPKNGEWVRFVLAGKFESASSEDKDAILTVSKNGPPIVEIGRHSLMVRVRKDATKLSIPERNRFLVALGTLVANNEYNKYQAMHQLTSIQGHGQAGFPPWHRAMILQLERELQEIDPSVSLPYWDFKQPPGDIFTSEFMGANGFAPGVTTPVQVRFGVLALVPPAIVPTPHPLNHPNLPTFQRSLNQFAMFSVPSDVALKESVVIAPFKYVGFQGRGRQGLSPLQQPAGDVGLEERAHNGVHGYVGGDGPLSVPATAVRDPIFFLLHCNVDRLWAAWQKDKVRFDPSKPDDYDPQGAFVPIAIAAMVPPRPFVFKGHFVNDTMWPWDGDAGDGSMITPLDDRPTWAAAASFPLRDGFGPPQKPKISDMVDYQGRLERSSDLGFCYDSLPF